jgi:hypothetical protein
MSLQIDYLKHKEMFIWYRQLGFAKSWGLVGEGYTNLTKYYHRLKPILGNREQRVGDIPVSNSLF